MELSTQLIKFYKMLLIIEEFLSIQSSLRYLNDLKIIVNNSVERTGPSRWVIQYGNFLVVLTGKGTKEATSLWKTFDFKFHTVVS